MNWFKEFPRQEFLSLIATGKTEDEALRVINGPRGSKSFAPAVLVQYQVKDSSFREELEEAKKQRADVWFNGIIKDVADTELTKEDVPVAKLKFEQRKYLAAIDNPEKYSEKINHKLEVGINIFQEMKDLPQNEIRKMMQTHDPFSLPPDVVEADLAGDKNEIDEDREGMNAGFKSHVLSKWSDDEEDIFA